MTQLPKPIAAAAGVGDLAVEKVRELSAKAADRLSAMDSDPSAFADRVQSDIETRAESLGTAFRSAQSTVREQSQDLSHRAQDLLQAAVVQAGEAYESLAKRGETVVDRASEQRSLPDVPGLRMIKPAPADEQADADAESDAGAAKSTAAKSSAAKSSAAKSSTPKSSTPKSTTAKSATAKSSTPKPTTAKSSTASSTGKKAGEKSSTKPTEQSNGNGGRGRNSKPSGEN